MTLRNPLHYISRSSTLIRHFILRTINNDALLFDKSRRVNLIALFSLLTASIGFFAHLQLRLYLFGLRPDSQKIWLESTYFLTMMMALAGILFTIMWDNLSPDHRDYVNLLTLPLKPNILFISKFLSIVLFIAITTVIFNFFSTLIFSFYLTRQSDNDPVRLGLTHLLVHFLGYLFIFLTIACLQAMVKNLARGKWYHRISNLIQILLLTVFISTMVWFPLSYPVIDALKTKSVFYKFAFPPLWFVGFGEKLSGNRTSWLTGYTHITLIAFTVLVGLYILSLPAGFRKFQKMRPEKKKTTRERKVKKFFQAGFDSRILKNPLEVCSFYFFSKTLNRSRKHKLILLKFWIIPLIIIFVFMSGLYVKSETAAFETINIYLVSIPLFLLFFLVMGIRIVIAFPVNPGASWVFQIKPDRDNRFFINGLKKAFIFTIIIPAMLGFYLVYAYLWGFGPAANHTLFTLATSMLLLHLVFTNSTRIPFVSTTNNMNQRRRIMWPFILTGAAIYTYIFSRLGIFLIRTPEYYFLFYLSAMLVYFLSRWVHYYYFRELVFSYNTALQKVIVSLELDTKGKYLI